MDVSTAIHLGSLKWGQPGFVLRRHGGGLATINKQARGIMNEDALARFDLWSWKLDDY